MFLGIIVDFLRKSNKNKFIFIELYLSGMILLTLWSLSTHDGYFDKIVIVTISVIIFVCMIKEYDKYKLNKNKFYALKVKISNQKLVKLTYKEQVIKFISPPRVSPSLNDFYPKEVILLDANYEGYVLGDKINFNVRGKYFLSLGIPINVPKELILTGEELIKNIDEERIFIYKSEI